MSCPNDSGTCRCTLHHPGLLATSSNPAALAECLDRIRTATAPTTLRVLTTTPDNCNGTMTCPCQRCTRQRGILVNEQRAAIAQPWHPRPARHAA